MWCTNNIIQNSNLNINGFLFDVTKHAIQLGEIIPLLKASKLLTIEINV